MNLKCIQSESYSMVHTSVIIIIRSNISRLSSILLNISACLFQQLGDKCNTTSAYVASNYDYDASVNQG